MTTATSLQCVLVADVSGSLTLQEKLDDAELRRSVERCLNRIERISAAHLGRVVKILGGEAWVVFGSAEAGFLAACEIQQKIDDLPPISGHKLAIRIGTCFGDVSEIEGDVVGGAAVAARQMLALARPGQVITDEAMGKQLPLPCLAKVRQFETVGAEAGRAPLLEILWRDEEMPALVPDHFAPTKPMELNLRLRHGGKELFVSRKRPAVSLGRERHSDIVIRDLRASRHHARIELRYDRFVLIDQSSNGTFIATESGSSRVVRNEEATLHGRGRVSFGQPYQEGVPDYVEYIVID